MANDTLDIINLFAISGEVAEISPFGSGRINDTFKVTTTEDHQPNYLLQRINHQIFSDVEGLMQNITGVTNYLKTELKKPIYKDARQQVLEPILTHSGRPFVKKNGYWRMYLFLDDLKSYDRAESLDQVYEGAKAFGLFLKLLHDFPRERLITPIKDFHNIMLRLDTLNAVYSKSGSIKEHVKEEIRYIYEMADEMSIIQKLMDVGKIPIRVTHNDTKFNNVLLDENNKARCVIDLDTVMPGIVHYDFSDGIKTGTCLVDEEEQDINLFGIDLARFEAFTTGYLEHTRDLLTPIELDYLAPSAALFPYMQGVRFLTDYLQGNTYYKTKYPEHNLTRARGQLQLSRRILERKKDLEERVGAMR